ncbi:hypothetical protein ACEWY4_020694 [Coilia grayii]|uniref:Uncharacterized protein n=1 Tax=Coilia grayii TaxID=363190 RepID=A0ABD1J899_9TELE
MFLSITRHCQMLVEISHACLSLLFYSDSHNLGLAYTTSQQSTSDLERVMAKLCVHHQRQIVDALGYLETEVKAVASSSVAPQVSLRAAGPDERTSLSAIRAPRQECSNTQCTDRTLTLSPKARCKAAAVEFAVQGSSKKEALEKSSYYPDVHGSALIVDLRRDENEGGNILSSLLTSSHGYESVRHPFQSPQGIRSTNSEYRTPAKDKGASNHLFCTGTLEEHQNVSDTSIQTGSRDSDVIEAPPSCQPSEPLQPASEGFSGHTKDIPTPPSLIQRTSATVSPNPPRTARKSRRGSLPRTKDGFVCRIDPDINCDIVYIGKSITECHLEPSNRMLPRRNARKSIRGHMYTEDYLELKTVRTLARKSAGNETGNCPAPMPVITMVTPKQVLAKPDGVPPVDMPFAGGCGDSLFQTSPSETSGETEMVGDVLSGVSDINMIVETSQTGQTTCPEKVDDSAQSIIPVVTVETQKGSLPEEDGVLCSTEPLDQQSVELPARDDQNKVDDQQIEESADNVEPVSEMTKEDLPRDPSPVPLPVLDDKGVDESIVRNESPALAQEEEEEEEDPNVKELSSDVELNDRNVNLEILADVEEQSAVETSTLQKEPVDDLSRTDDEVSDKQSGIQAELNTLCSHSETENKVVDDVDHDVEPADEYTCSDTPPETFSEKETVVREVLSSPEGKKPKRRRNVRTFGSSDRQLRSRASDVQDTSLTPEKSDQITAAQLSESVVEQTKCLETKRPLRSVKAKALQSDASNDEVLQSAVVCREQSQEHSTDKLDVKPDSSPCENSVADQVMQTRKMLRSTPARQKLDSEGEQKIFSPSPITDDQPSTTEEQKEKEAAVETNKALLDTTEQATVKDLHVHDSPSKDGVMELVDSQSVSSVVASPRVSGHMPLRNRTSPVDSNKHLAITKSAEKCEPMPERSESTDVVEDKPEHSQSTGTSSVVEKSRHMPLRSRSQGVDSDSSSSSANISENAGRMPLRSSSAIAAIQATSPTVSSKDKKVQRSPRPSKSGVLSSDTDTEPSLVGSPAKPIPERNVRGQKRRADIPVDLPGNSNSEPIVPRPSKFLEALSREENQHLITNLNSKFDKMQKGWVQIDKEGPQAQRSRNKADRLKHIWKSKRRIRKPRPLEPHRFSPVQMLFMKPFDLSSICRWFLQSTETKSLVIVKHLNTRHPSETQLCFQSSSSMAGASHGNFPSVQAERLKKHLKKFAIASPVKNNAKSQKLIAEALEPDPTNIKGKNKHQLTTATRMSTKPQSFRGVAQCTESQKISGAVKNPASARILRKYSHMREKMQGQQKSRKLQDPKAEHDKGVSKPKLPTATQQKLALSKRNSGKDTNVSKEDKTSQSVLSRRSATRTSVKEKVTKAASPKAVKDLADKDGPAPKRSQHTQMSPKPQRTTTATAMSPKTNANKKENPTEKHASEKSPQTPTSDSKAEMRKPVPTKAPAGVVSPAQSPDSSGTQDQVLTRSQRKMEAAQRLGESPKSATKRTQDPIATPVKRTRTSLSKTN